MYSDESKNTKTISSYHTYNCFTNYLGFLRCPEQNMQFNDVLLIFVNYRYDFCLCREFLQFIQFLSANRFLSRLRRKFRQWPKSGYTLRVIRVVVHYINASIVYSAQSLNIYVYVNVARQGLKRALIQNHRRVGDSKMAMQMHVERLATCNLYMS